MADDSFVPVEDVKMRVVHAMVHAVGRSCRGASLSQSFTVQIAPMDGGMVFPENPCF